MKLIEEFVSYLEGEARDSSHTVEAYGRDLRQFAEWLKGSARADESDKSDGSDMSDGSGHTPTADACFIPWDRVKAADVREWIGALADEGREPTTLRRKAQSIRAFFKWGQIRGIFESNPAADVPLVKKRRHLPDFIKEGDLEVLLSDTLPEDFTAARTQIALTLLYSLGLRQAELLSLTDADIRADGLELRVTGKRNKQRVLPVPEQLRNLLRQWQQRRDAHFPDLAAPRPIIAGPHGALSKEMLYRIVREGLAGVSTGRKSPHTLRHSFATAMLNHGADIDAVREMLGHTSLQTTQIYTHVSYKELMANYAGAHPRSRTKKEADKK